jgi:pilus assembly protein TadC
VNLLAVLAVAAAFGGLSGLVYFLKARGGPRLDESSFADARSVETDSLTRFFIDASKPMSSLPLVSDKDSTLYRLAQSKLLAAGGAYNGNVEVFLSVQALATMIAVAVFLLTVAGVVPALLGLGGLGGIAAGFVLAFAVGSLPYAMVDRKARGRVKEIEKGLPEFAELLQMPLTAGLSVMAAIEFTARNTTGPVSEEASNVVLVTKTRTLTDAEAFDLAGRRLGTPEARAFFNALRQAHIEGSRVVEVLGKQAESLRTSQFQRQRDALKRMPVKLIVVFAIFLLPPVVVLILLTFVAAFQQV